MNSSRVIRLIVPQLADPPWIEQCYIKGIEDANRTTNDNRTCRYPGVEVEVLLMLLRMAGYETVPKLSGALAHNGSVQGWRY